MPELRELLQRLALCAGVAWLGWHFLGPFGLALLAPLYGVLLARPLLDVTGIGMRAIRARALADREGHHYEYRGIHVRIIEDHEHRRWIRAVDVRRIIGSGDSDGALQLTYGAGFRLEGKPPQGYFSEAALLAHLARHGTATASRLRLWVEGQVVMPARQRRRRLGIHSPDPATLGND